MQNTWIDQNIQALLSTTSWGAYPVSFGFPDEASDYSYSGYMFNGFIPLEDPLQKLIRNTLTGGDGSTAPSDNFMELTSVMSFSNINLYFRGYGDSDISVARSSWIDRSFAYYPQGFGARNGDVWLGAYTDDARIGTFPHATILHELGHALGLKHGHEGDNGNNIVLSPDRDSIEFSIMTYRTHVGDDGTLFDADGPSTFMMYDIAALQYLYGANFNTNNTNTVYTWDRSGEVYVNGILKGNPYSACIFMTIWDGGGVDTYDLSNAPWGAVKIDLTPGEWSTITSEPYRANLGDGIKARGNIANALQYNDDPRSLIENAFGGRYDDEIRGNAAQNHLKGGGGNDKLFGLANGDHLQGEAGDDALQGGSGIDNLDGGAGNDTLQGGSGADHLDGGSGSDTADYSDTGTSIYINLQTGEKNGLNVTGDIYTSIENVFAGWGNDTIYGDAGANTINGHFGNDTIYGGAGGDHLVGGEGNDLLVVTQDFAHLTGWGGQDTFKISPGATGYIWDFEATFGLRDKVDISGVFTGYADLWAHTSESGGDTIIAKGTTKIVFKDTARAWLQQEDFIL